MKKETTHFAGIVMAAGAAVVLFCASPAGTSPSFRITVPTEALAFDDGLDVRDNAGRAVQNPAARRQLKDLFVATAFRLLTRPELPRVAETLAALERAWNFAQGALTGAWVLVWNVWVELWNPPTRKFGPPAIGWALALLAALAALAGACGTSFCPLATRLKILTTVTLRC